MRFPRISDPTYFTAGDNQIPPPVPSSNIGIIQREKRLE